MKQAIKSKTIKWNLIMAALQVLNANVMMMEILFAPEVFVMVSMAIAVAHSVGGVYLRYITDKPLNEL
jgi:hypothetical protein